MGCAAIAIGTAASLSVPLYTAFCIVLAANLSLSLLIFLGRNLRCRRPAAYY
jgi:hypothetical protein